MEQIEINEKAVERLKRKIILQENQNLKTRAMTCLLYTSRCV